MPSINLNQIRTGSNSVDRLVSAAGAIAANPQAGLSIAKNLINNGTLKNLRRNRPLLYVMPYYSL